MDSIAKQLHDLWFEFGLDTNRPDLSKFAMKLISLSAGGIIMAKVVDSTSIQFVGWDGSQATVLTAHAKSIFRMLCARLGKIGSDHMGGEFNPYGGRYRITARDGKDDQMQVDMNVVNTTSSQIFQVERIVAK